MKNEVRYEIFCKKSMFRRMVTISVISLSKVAVMSEVSALFKLDPKDESLAKYILRVVNGVIWKN